MTPDIKSSQKLAPALVRTVSVPTTMSAPRRRFLLILTATLLGFLTVSPLHAQTQSIDLQVNQVNETARTVIRATLDSGASPEGFRLCIPNCSSPLQTTDLPGSLGGSNQQRRTIGGSNYGANWSITFARCTDSPGDGLSSFFCQANVEFEALQPGTTSAELLILQENTTDSGPAVVTAGQAVITGQLNAPPINPGVVSFESDSSSVREGNSIPLNVVRSNGSDGAVEVQIMSVDGSAVAGLDYQVAPTTLRWADGQTGSQQVTLRALTDTLVEQTETLQLLLETSAGGPALGQTPRATISILDVAPANPGFFEFDPASYTIAEPVQGVANVALRVLRRGGTDGSVAVTVSTVDGTAEAGSDYRQINGNLEWGEGVGGAQTLSVAILADTRQEAIERFTARLSSPRLTSSATEVSTSPTLGNLNEATVSISDTPPLPQAEPGTIEFRPASYSVAEGNVVTVSAVRRDGSDGSVAVSIQTADGTATAGMDYVATTGRLAWDDGEVGAKTLRIQTNSDTQIEVTENFSVALSNPVQISTDDELPAPTIGTARTARVSITDDTPEPRLDSGIISLSSSRYSVTEDDGSLSVLVTRQGAAEGVVSIDYSTVAGSATSGIDYTARNGTLEWDDGEVGSREVVVPIAADGLLEEIETFSIVLDNAEVPEDTDLVVGTDRAQVSISDTTDFGAPVLLTTSVIVREIDGAAEISVERSGGSDGVLQVDYRTVSGTAIQGADFRSVSGTLEWATGDNATQRVTIPILTDDLIEDLEQFTLVFDNARPSSEAGATTLQATIDIEDSSSNTGSVREEQTVFALSVVSGNNQSAFPGDTLESLVLQARQMDQNAEPVEELEINWRVLPAGAAELLDGEQTLTDGSGMTGNRIRVLSRGFITVIARAGAVRTQNASSGGEDEPPGPTARINPPQIATDELEIAFTVRSGLEAGMGLSSNQSATGAALDSACEALDAQAVNNSTSLSPAQADLQASCRRLETLLDNGNLAAALDRLAPEELFTLSDSVIETADLQITNVFARINAIRGGQAGSIDVAGLSLQVQEQHIPGTVLDAAVDHWSGGGAAADGSSRLSFFANGSLSTGDVDGGDQQQDADVSSQGVTLGLDYRVSERMVVGLGVGIANNKTDFSSDVGGVELNATSVTAFGTWYDANSTYVDVVVDYGQNAFEIERAINLPDRPLRLAQGSTNASLMSLTLGVGSDLQLGSVQLGPYGRLSFINSAVDGYRETTTGSGEGIGALLDISKHDIRSTRVAIGGQMSKSISTGSAVLVPQLRVEAEFETVDSKDGIQASFLADSSATLFEIQGNTRDTSYLNVGLGTSVILANGRSGFVFYETQAGHDYVSQHFLKFGIRLEF